MTPFELNIRQQDGRHQRIWTLLPAVAERLGTAHAGTGGSCAESHPGLPEAGWLEGHDSIVGNDEICETVRSDKLDDRPVEILFGDLTGPSTGKSGV